MKPDARDPVRKDAPDTHRLPRPRGAWLQETRMKLWKYLEAHHEELGAGLFILPCLVVTMVAASIVYAIALLLQ